MTCSGIERWCSVANQTQAVAFTLGNMVALWSFFLCIAGHWSLLEASNATWAGVRCGNAVEHALKNWLYISSLTTIITTLICLALYNATHWPPLENERDSDAETSAQRLSYRLPFFITYVFYAGRSLLLLYRAIPLLSLCTHFTVVSSGGGGILVVMLQCLTYGLSPMGILLYSVIELNKCS